MNNIKYLIIGAGGTGGSIAAFMMETGKDVTAIARGNHLEAIRQKGMKMETTLKGNYTVYPLKDSGITCIVSEDIRRDALQKFSYVSPMSACSVYYDIDAGSAQQEGKVRDTFVSLMREIEALAVTMGIHFTVDIVKTNLGILDKLSPVASTSLQRDLKKGKNSEIDGLVFEVVRLGKQYGVKMPVYEMIAEKYGFKT